MNNDRILKKSLFGGFKREDVLDYVEKLQSENVSLASELREKSVECAELSGIKEEYDELKNNYDSLVSRASELSSSHQALADSNSELMQRANRAEALYESNLHELESLKAKCAELEEKSARSESAALLNSELEARVLGAQANVATLETELSETKEKYSALETEFTKLSEEQSNALIQNAMKYSDTLVTEANETANKVIGEAGSSIGGATEEISAAGERLKTAQVNLDYSLNSVRSSVDALLDTLSKCSSELMSGD